MEIIFDLPVGSFPIINIISPSLVGSICGRRKKGKTVF